MKELMEVRAVGSGARERVETAPASFKSAFGRPCAACDGGGALGGEELAG